MVMQLTAIKLNFRVPINPNSRALLRFLSLQRAILTNYPAKSPISWKNMMQNVNKNIDTAAVLVESLKVLCLLNESNYQFLDFVGSRSLTGWGTH
ncbi:hypothetical protein L1987_12461 [Smallanthus sonchifolius]|uniref:Uncharacterized protein n=1 Tax=Smallanthus sonchifolius TaxID=185202 RepID=A0ACB9JEQ7_9ASTR|nr:hypothetical protein L1987_12461 [Smallanthus sonchifolius]